MRHTCGWRTTDRWIFREGLISSPFLPALCAVFWWIGHVCRTRRSGAAMRRFWSFLRTWRSTRTASKETAEVLRVSEETIRKDWNFTKSWLRRELSRGHPLGN
ncbi:MAG: ECF-type sigma factor [Bryobacteraceae bacterium]